METVLNLKVSSEEFFDFLILSVVNDVEASTDRTVQPEDIIQGFHYTKELKNKIGRAGKIKVTISHLDLNKKYEATFESNQGDNKISYEIETLDDNTINVTYSEGYIAEGRIKKWNFNIMNFFYKRRAKKKSTTLLRNIEHYIIENRGNE